MRLRLQLMKLELLINADQEKLYLEYDIVSEFSTLSLYAITANMVTLIRKEKH